ncbi:MAG: pyruvate ferredoxin oxidoreductase [Burkholderiales bacterium]|jgi:pyruvate ferredoxin oxidoreductase alpha subunit|nr:pyruvate ferredoxin oxidoreductase [Burkholderiales bacterium]
MRQPLEGSQAIARAVVAARAQVVAAYPITPQTHIVEHIARMVADGAASCELVSVESEFSAASVVLGAAMAGSRAYTATASQGLLLMGEVLYNIAGLRVPLVMTVANRALSAPLSIWNDQQDSMAMRDAGWVQLYCSDNQEAVDTTIQAFRIAETLEVPVMVCVDGFTLTHTLEAIELPEQEVVDRFLPPYRFARALDPLHPKTFGTLVGPEYYAEMRELHHRALLAALEVIPRVDEEWAAATGRASGGLLRMEGDSEARTGVLTLGSIFGTLADAREVYADCRPLRLVHLRCFRPFPAAALRAAAAGLERLVVLERAISPGAGGIVTAEVRAALAELDRPPQVHGFAVGLGGRDVPLDLLPRLLASLPPRPGPFRIFDLDVQKLPEGGS